MSAKVDQSELMELRGFDDSPQKEVSHQKKPQQQKETGSGNKARQDGTFVSFWVTLLLATVWVVVTAARSPREFAGH